MKRFLCLVLSVLALAMLPGCKTNPIDPETGQPIAVPPPTPEEVRALVYASTRVALSKWGPRQEPEQLQQVRNSLEGVRTAMSATLALEEPDLTQVRFEALDGIDPELVAALDVTLAVVIGRVRPYIDQAQTDEAMKYMNAGIDGALLALDTYGPDSSE